ncbi:unnamed protein product [Amoebophrya sp. A25]|nr:unnamed protein product [Amoebophrya sp. A25]|eukprot:GSA25T00020542001.1
MAGKGGVKTAAKNTLGGVDLDEKTKALLEKAQGVKL